MSSGEIALASQLDAYKIPYSREHRFHPKRRWRIDFAFPDKMLACEIEGGVWGNGRHLRPTGYLKDMEKYNELSKLGWKLLRFTPQQVKHGMAILQIKEFLGVK